MKNRENEKYIKLGITGFAVMAASMVLFFLIFNLKGISGAMRMLAKILSPFLYGAVIAYLVTPLCRRLEKLFKRLFRGKRDGLAGTLSILVSLLLAVIVVLAMLLLVIPQLVTSIANLIAVLPAQFRAAELKLNGLLEDHPDWLARWNDISGNLNSRVEHWINTDLPRAAQTMMSGAGRYIAGIFGILNNLVLGMIVSIYLLARRRQLGAQAKLMLCGVLRPRWADWVEGEVHFADRMFNGFFMGKLLDSAIIGVLCFIGCVAMGFRSSALIAVLVGVTNIIPFFGPYMGAIPSALLLVLDNPMHCLMFIIFIIILQQIDGNVIGPRILGNSTGLSGLWVMFSILLFGGLWGIGGMIVGVPLMAVIYDIVRQLTFYGLRRHGHGEMIEAYNRIFHAPRPGGKKSDNRDKA